MSKSLNVKSGAAVAGAAPCYAAPRNVETRNLRCEISGVEYKWSGGFGAIIKSYERGLKPGDVRMIADVPFHVYTVCRGPRWWWWQKPEVFWTIPNAHLSVEWIRAFKSAIFAA